MPDNRRYITTVVSMSSTSLLLQFQHGLVAEVCALPDKCCAFNPFLTELCKSVADIIVLVLKVLVNRLLSIGCFSEKFKIAYITPLLNKSDLVPADAQSCRPIPNLWVLSIMLKRLIACTLHDHLNRSGCCHVCSSPIPRQSFD
jgi:hypothetical protein